MADGSLGYRAGLAMRQPTPGLISSSPGTAGLPPFISFSTSYPELNSAVLRHTDNERFVASLDRKRLGQGVLWKTRAYTRGVFDKETRRKPLAFAADALSYGI